MFCLFCIRLAEWVELGEFNQNQSSMTDRLLSPTHSWLCGVVVMTPDWESVGWGEGGSNAIRGILFIFWKEKSSLISLILNTKSEKHECF